MIFVSLTRYAAGRKIPVNSSVIAYLDACEGGANVAFASGETIRVSETPDEILAAIFEAEAQCAAGWPNRQNTTPPIAPIRQKKTAR
jgi:hypothetical protein